MGEAVEETRNGRGPGCFCRIAKELLGRDSDEESLRRWCSGDHTDCPTWQTFREAELQDSQRQLEREVSATIPRELR